MQEHFDDKYVKEAKEQGYRSRACFKLLEIQEKDGLFKKGMTVLDLGSAPGGWSQVAAKLVGPKGTVIASDILPMEPIAGVTFIEGDFTTDEVYEEILAVIGDGKVDLVISDMAPNISGNSSIDQPKSLYLTELALDMAQRVLKPEGAFVVKVFQGAGFDAYRQQVKDAFNKMITRKPDSSRARSSEVYLLGLGHKQ